MGAGRGVCGAHEEQLPHEVGRLNLLLGEYMRPREFLSERTRHPPAGRWRQPRLLNSVLRKRPPNQGTSPAAEFVPQASSLGLHKAGVGPGMLVNDARQSPRVVRF